MFFFALVMLIQMIGMLLHRIMTLGHIVSSTEFRYCSPVSSSKCDRKRGNKSSAPGNHICEVKNPTAR
jgi:hypothetical protein